MTRILIVEDDAEGAVCLRRTLEKLGYEVAGAVSTVGEAIDAAAASPPDLALVDIVLDGSPTGIAAARELDQRLQVPCVFVTAHVGEPLVDEARLAAPYGYVIKPVSPPALRASIEMALHRHRADRRIRELEARYRFLTERLADVVWTADLDLVATYISPAVGRLTGHRPDEIVGRPPSDYLDAPSIERARAVLSRELSRDGQPGVDPDRSAIVEMTYTHRNGSAVLTEISFSYVRDAQGRPVGLHGITRDVTDRRRLETGLLEAQERYARVFQSSPIPMAICTLPDDRLVEVNEEFLRATGFERHEVVWKGVAEMGLWADPAERARLNRQVEEQGSARAHLVRMRTKAGQVREMLLSASRVDIGGQPCLLASGVDVTARQLAERRQALTLRILQVLNERSSRTDAVRRVLELVRDETGVEAVAIRLAVDGDFPIIHAVGVPESLLSEEPTLCARDADGSITRDGSGQPELTCLCGAVIRGRVDLTLGPYTESGSFWTNGLSGLVKLLGPALGPTPARMRCLSLGFQSLALIPLRSGAETIGLLQLMDPRPDLLTLDQVRFLEGIGLSIGMAVERGRAEDELRKSRDGYQRLFDSANDALFVFPIGPDGRLEPFSQVNDKVCRWLGYSREDLLGLRLSDIACSLGREQLAEILETLNNHGTSIFEIDLAGSTRESRTVEVSSHLFNLDGKPHVLAIARDLSERRRAEADRRSLQEQLLRAQKLEAIGLLAGGIAHDFNNLLTTILGNAQALGSEAPPGSERAAGCESIELAARRAAELTRQLLGFARKGKLQSVPVDLHGLADDLASLLLRTVDKRIAVRQVRGASASIVIGDPTQLQQVLLNLAVNARDAMPSGGLLSVETENVEVPAAQAAALGVGQSGSFVKISVVDSGCGIPQENLGRIFDPFFTTKPVGQGTGLGLAMVYGIVKSHGGSVRVESQVGSGSRFEILLPAVAGGLAPVAAVAKTPVSGRGHVLLVDDEEGVRTVGARLLRKLGYEVTTAADGRAALAAFESSPGRFGLVILDLMMPEMKRAYATSEVREMIEFRLKAQRDEATRLARARREGIADGLEKGRAEGKAEGKTEGLREAARRLLDSGMDRDTVLSTLGLPPDFVL
ncbi:MAG: PAS domain S-box protein [Candidatus Riflebacteria bacterium]|nr:PAS domain S-box protein [Candidatus Riflebacteria bacterium]